MSLLIESTIKVSLIILLALAAVALARKRSAALRHWVLAATVICAALTPLLGTVVPSWRPAVDVLPSAPSFAPAAMPVAGSETRGGQPTIPGAGIPDDAVPRAGMTQWLLPVWAAGAFIGVGILLLGFVRLAWLAASAERVTDPRLVRLSEGVARAYGLRRAVTLLQSAHPVMLATWGLRRPKVMLPAGIGDWSDERVRVVLSHELAHVCRADWVVQIAAELLRSVYWFNPLLWIACRRLRQESEHACDDAVLSLGVEGSDYATELLDLARAARARRRTWIPAPAMAHTSSLERRVRAMLNDRLNRAPIGGRGRFATAVALVTITVAISGLQTFAQSFATFSGSVFDSTNRVLPSVTLVLTNVQSNAKFEVKSGPSGQFEFVGLPLGDYTLQAQLPGFATLNGTVKLTGRTATRDMTLQVGSLEETITVIDRAPGTEPPKPPPPVVFPPRAARPAANCDAIPVGGNIRPPMKTRDVRPIFPENLHGAGTEGTVVLDTIMNTEGHVREVQPVGSPNPDFLNAAVEAVRQWEFTQTLLNCVPVEVSMKVTLQFLARARTVKLQLTLPDGARPVMLLRQGEMGTISAGDVRYGLRAYPTDPFKGIVAVNIQEGTAANGKVVRRLMLSTGQPPVSSDTVPPFRVALVQVVPE